MTRPRRQLALAAAALLTAALAPAPASATHGPTFRGGLDQGDWPRICANSPASWRSGGPIRATARFEAHCRVIRVGDDDRPRRFIVVAPRRALQRARTPVVFYFHGTNNNGEKHWNITRWRELAHRLGFVVVFPSSLAYRSDDGHTIDVWNIVGQACDHPDGEQLADDVAFVRAMHAELTRRLRVDPSRTYAAGFSNGGEFVHRLAAEAGDIFAAAAAWGAIPAEECAEDPVVPASAPLIPVWNGMGSRDHMYKGANDELPIDSAGVRTSFAPMFATSARMYSVTEAPTREQTIAEMATVPARLPVAPSWSPVFVQDPAPGNTAGNTYSFVLLDELGHKYPNAWPGHGRETRASLGVTMAALHAQWLIAHPRPAAPVQRRPRLPRRPRP